MYITGTEEVQYTFFQALFLADEVNNTYTS